MLTSFDHLTSAFKIDQSFIMNSRGSSNLLNYGKQIKDLQNKFSVTNEADRVNSQFPDEGIMKSLDQLKDSAKFENNQGVGQEKTVYLPGINKTVNYFKKE